MPARRAAFFVAGPIYWVCLLREQAAPKNRPPWLGAAACSGGFFRMFFREEVEDVSYAFFLARTVPKPLCAPSWAVTGPPEAGPAQRRSALAGWLLNGRGSLFLDIARFLDSPWPASCPLAGYTGRIHWLSALRLPRAEGFPCRPRQARNAETAALARGGRDWEGVSGC